MHLSPQVVSGGDALLTGWLLGCQKLRCAFQESDVIIILCVFLCPSMPSMAVCLRDTYLFPNIYLMYLRLHIE